MRCFIATLASAHAGGRIEVWIDNDHHLGTLSLKSSGTDPKPQETKLTATTITGPHDVTLKFLGGKGLGLLHTIEFR